MRSLSVRSRNDLKRGELALRAGFRGQCGDAPPLGSTLDVDPSLSGNVIRLSPRIEHRQRVEFLTCVEVRTRIDAVGCGRENLDRRARDITLSIEPTLTAR